MHGSVKSGLIGFGLLTFGLTFLGNRLAWSDDRYEDLQTRLEALEKSQLEIQRKEGLLQTFDSKTFNLGGFTNTIFSNQFGAPSGTQNGFQESDLNLLMSGTIRDRLKFFFDFDVGYESSFENENAPWRSLGPRELHTELEIATLEYTFDRRLSLQIGRLITPFGILNVDHYDPLLLQVRKPQAFRDTSETNFLLFEDDIVGTQVFGAWSLVPDHMFGYAAYVGTDRGSTGSVTPGGSLYWIFPNDVLRIGLSTQFPSQIGNRRSSVYGTDLKLNFKSFVLQAEYMHSFVENSQGATSYYVQPSWRLFDGKWIVFAQLDYLNDPLGVRAVDHDQDPATPVVFDPIEKYEYTLGLNYLPFSVWRMRLEYTRNHYVGSHETIGGLSRDYNGVTISSTLSF